MNKIVPNHTMTPFLQYYEKNTICRFCFTGFLILVFTYNGYSQTAKFSFEKRNTCAPARVIFYNESSTGEGIRFEWNFGNGSISYSSEKVLEEVYPNPGTYTVELKAIQGTDTAKTASVVAIFNGPAAQFTADQTEGCVPLEIGFHNASETGDAAISNYYWDFRDGTVEFSENPKHRYTRAGIFDVYLKVTDINGCTDYTESKGFISVHPEPEIRFSASDTIACEPPLTVNFTNRTAADVNLDYHWDFGNGDASEGTNATTLYSTSGSYSVILRCSNAMGCTGSLTKESYIQVGESTGGIWAMQGNDTLAEENAMLCPGPVRFGSASGSTDYTWYIRYNQQQFILQGREFNYTLTDSGQIDLKLVYGNNSECPDSALISFRVGHIKADFDMDRETSCELPTRVALTDRSSNAVFRKWILPDGSEDTTGNIDFTITHTLTYEEVYSHTVNRLRFPFIHIAAGANGCRDTVTKDFRVSLPVARFVPDRVSGCTPLGILFSDSSRSDEPIEKRTLIINGIPSGVSGELTYGHTFSEPGEFEVLLVIENSTGCSDTSFPVIIQAGSRLKPDFTVFPGQVCPGAPIRLEDITIPQNSIDFRHFSSPGLFTTTLTVNSAVTVEVLPVTAGYKAVELEVGYNGCISDTLFPEAFYVYQPAGSFHESFSCDSPMVYTFVSDVPMAGSVEWKINDSLVSNLDSMDYRFPSSGDYRVTLTAFSNSTLCSTVLVKIIKVRNVKADFLADPIVCFGDTVKFNAVPSEDYINDCYNEGFLWNFQDFTPRRRTFSTLYNHVFSDTGTFSPMLIVRADNGCEDTISKKIRVLRPDALFVTNGDEGCTSGFTVRFTKTSTDTLPVTWEWDFGDNTFDRSSTSTVQHTYTSKTSHMYPACLTVQDMYGCRNSFCIPILLDKPNVSFQSDETFICTGESVNFSALYDSFDSFQWDFGDGSISTVSHSHVYSSPGIFDVTLSAVKNGCMDSLQRRQYIYAEKADATYIVSDSIFDCYPATVSFSHTGSGQVAEGIWTFAPGVQSAGYRKTYQYTYSRPGIYTTSLWVKTPNNCQATRSKTITVEGPYATFEFEPASICYGDPVSFHITSSQDVSEMRWLFGDGETSADLSPVHNYKAKGIVYPSLWVKNNTCEATLTFDPLYISLVTAAFDFPDNRSAFCQYEEIQVSNQSTGYQEITWIIQDTLVIREPELAPIIFSSAGTVQIMLIASDANGCTDTLTKSITITSLPVFDIQGDTSICRGNASSLSIDPVNAGWSVLWQPAEGLNDPASFNPTVTADSTRYYEATVTDAGGCKSMKSILIRVKQPAVLNRIPLRDTSIFIGESIELIVESNDPSATYAWSPDYKISCTSCNRPVVAPEHDIVYAAAITDECFSLTEEFPVDVIIDFYIEAPDAFSPNGDLNNDVFRLETKNIREIKEFKIFNRWGDLVFETTRLDEGWDGTAKGKIQNIDTYAFYVRAITIHGYETEKKGTFMLIK
jgi:gliding motility-associated-like protein